MGSRHGRLRPLLIVLCLLAAPIAAGGPAHAQSINDRFSSALEAVQEGLDVLWPDDWKKQGVRARLGVGFGMVPDYVGSDNYRFKALPIIDIHYKDIWRLNGSTLTYNLYKKGYFEAGPLLNLHFGRRQSRNPALHGLGDIPTTLQVGAFARYSTPTMLASGEILQALGGGQGLIFKGTLGHGLFKVGNLAGGVGIRTKWYSRQAMQTNFGITPDQAAHSEAGLDAFEAHAGFSEVSANMLSVYRANDYSRIFLLVSVGRLLGDAAQSPLTGHGQGSNTVAIIGSAVTFQF